MLLHIFSSSSSCSIHQKVCRRYKGLQPYFVTVTELSLVVGRAPPENEFAYWMLLFAITLTTLFYTSKLNKTVSYRKQIARLHSCRRWCSRTCSNFYLIGGRLITCKIWVLFLIMCVLVSSRKFLARCCTCLTPRNRFSTQHVLACWMWTL